MASDSLKQVGRRYRKTIEETDFSTRRVAENFPQIERCRNSVGVAGSYRMEFKTYDNSGSTYLNIFIQEPFDAAAIEDNSVIPLSITQTGLGVGNDGAVGAQNIWHPLIYLGDINFAGGTFQVIINYTKYGTGTYEFKVTSDYGDAVLTHLTTIGASTITISLTESAIVGPDTRIIHNAYLYGLGTGFSIGGWIYYTTASIYLNGVLYTPKEIGI